jgi:signal transduction histidine kinase
MTTEFYILIIISMAGLGLIVIGFILVQVRNQKKLLEKQKQIAAVEISHQKKLLEAVITSQEAERQRIGSDLHDEVGSVLSSLRILIEKNNSNGTPVSDTFVKRSKELIDRVIVRTRQISHNLSPHIGGKFSFYDALHELCDTVTHSASLEIIRDFDEATLPASLQENVAVALYRVLAELINNTIRHARANCIRIVITIDRSIHIRYSDDGIGLAKASYTSSKGMGMQNIESRLNMIHASWQIEEDQSRGFAISITIPTV